jgi:hypothetical protein
MTKLALIVGGVVLMAGVALAGTLTSLGSADNNPASQTIAPPPATTTTLQSDDRSRGNEVEPAETAERQNEAGEDVSGPCDEAEHANDPRCTGAAVPNRADDSGDHSGRGSSGHDDSGHRGDDHGGDDD